MLFDDKRILFLDHRHIESSENVSLTLNPPAKVGPCLRVERPWEMRGARAYCVLEWQGQYRLYYKVEPEDGRTLLAFAVSSDGVSWERPDLGVVEFDGSTANNLVDIDGELPTRSSHREDAQGQRPTRSSHREDAQGQRPTRSSHREDAQGQRPNEVCVFVDPTGPDEHRFKAVCHSPAGGGMYLLTSPDGLRFARAEGHLLRFIVDNNNSSFYDPRIGKYVVYLRGWDRSRPIPPMDGTRSVLRAETDDLFRPIPVDQDAPEQWHVSPKWTDIVDGGLRRMNRELPTALRCDDLDPPEAGLYQAAAVQYLPEVYLAFPSLYYSYPWPPMGQFINDGTLDLQFASSRDGIEWRREYRGSYVRLDLPDGPCTKFMHMLVGMAPGGHRISQYYVGSRHTHGEGRTAKDVRVHRETSEGDPIAHRLEQRMDGFVSADSAYTGGTLVTAPFVLTGTTLRLNIDTSASGVAHAALLDDGGSPIPGFGMDECDRIQGNNTSYSLSWSGESDLSALTGRKIKLLLRSRSTKLFAVYP